MAFRSAATLLGVATLACSARAEIDFAHDVVPILEKHCAECHGGEEAEGGFSINTRELFLDDETAIPGDAAESYFLQLIEDPDPDYQMPPEDKPRVPAEHLAVLKAWVAEGMKWEPGFTFGEPTYEPPFRPRRPELPAITEGRENPVDRLLDGWMAENGVARPAAADDTTFLRRSHLDLVGLLPTPEETRSFLADQSPDKHARKIDELLARDLDYAEHWLTFWNDLLRNDYAGTGFITGGRAQVSAWLYDSLKANKPFDAMVRELIAPPDASSTGFIDGIKWRGTVSAGQTLPIQFSQSVSQSFLGINMKCASCHDSFIDRWTLADAYGLAAIYSEEPLELHRCDKPTGETAQATWLFPEIGTIDIAAPKPERLRQLAALMTHPENGRVPRTIVNRLWGQLMGRGIVHPLDAMQTEPWNEDLLDWLAADFQDNGFDLKRTIRTIATSQAYRSAPASHEENAEFTYHGPLPKRLTAEQFLDAVWRITGSAPAAYDAPVARGIVAPEMKERLSFESSWVWGPSVDHGPPPHGEKILLRREFSPTKKIRSAGIIAAADNAFVLYLNNQPVLRGENWTNLEAAPVGNRLRPGENRILVTAENRGPAPNAAGVFAALRIEYEDDSEEILVTDGSWQVSATVPDGERPGTWKLDEMTWESARHLPNTTWKAKTDARIGETLATASIGSGSPVRASLLKADDLMRSLGRPNRDQIVTSRPNELTTLEAIDLSTSETLIGHLREGAERYAADPELEGGKLVDELFLACLTRLPSAEERTLVVDMLGQQKGTAEVTDLLWTLMMTPEFLLVR